MRVSEYHKNDYQITIRIPVKALDDARARFKAHEILDSLKLPEECVMKLQEIRERNEPRGIRL